MGARMLKVVQVIEGCCWFSLMEEASAKPPNLEILPMLLAHLSVLILRPNPTHQCCSLPLKMRFLLLFFLCHVPTTMIKTLTAIEVGSLGKMTMEV